MKLNRRLLAGVAILAATAAIAQDLTSPNLQLLLMGQGLHANDWGSLTNQNLTKIENAVTGVSKITVSGSETTLTVDQARFASFILTGTLTQNHTLNLPAVPRDFNLVNGTTGAFSVTVSCGAGADVTVVQGEAYKLFCDGSAVYSATPRDLVPVGTMLPYAGSTPPDSNYAVCDGSTLDRTTYATLYSRIGTTYGSGNGVTTFNLPDSRGRVLAMADGGAGRLPGVARGVAVGSATAILQHENLPNVNFPISQSPHTHTATDSGHNHFYGTASSTAGGGFSAVSPTGGTIYGTSVGYANITVAPSTIGLTVNSGGSWTPFSIAQPTLGANCIIRVR